MKLPTVIVERVEPGSAADKAGLRRGDHLNTYADQPLTSPMMLLALEENTFGIESVKLCGERDGQPWDWFLPPGKSEAEVRPELPDTLLEEYESGRAALQSKKYTDAARIWSDIVPRVPQRAAGAWLYWKSGNAAESSYDWERGCHFYTQAHEILPEESDTAFYTVIWTGLGRCNYRRNDSETAKQWYEQAYRVNQVMERCIWAARDLNSLGNIAYYSCDLVTARDYYFKCLKIREQVAPTSSELADILHNIGNFALHHADIDTAHECFSRALSIWESLDPTSASIAIGLHNLGRASWIQGNIYSAKTHYERALLFFKRHAPDSIDRAAVLNDFGLVLWKHGDLATARDYFSQAFSIHTKFAPDSLSVAANLSNLGLVANLQGDLDAAEDYHRRSFIIRQSLAPGSLDLAVSLNNLGTVLFQRGDLQGAQEHHTKALALRERHAPGSAEVALSLTNLGNVASASGDLVVAQDYHLSALNILKDLTPGSIEIAETLERAGNVALRRSHYDKAIAWFAESVEIVERHRTQIASPEARVLLLSQHVRNYAGLLQAYLTVGDVASAFHTLERTRARSFAEMLTIRGLDTTDAPPELLEEQQEVDRQCAQTYYQLNGLTGANKDAEAVERLHRTLRELERRQQEFTARIRTASPHYASLQYPQPLTLAATQAVLAPGTLLLSYFVDEDQTFLFAVSDTQAEAHTLPVGRQALHEQVRAFRQALDRNRLAYDSAQETAWGRTLYALLVRPAQKAVRSAERLLLCPDGPLHALPFTALVTNNKGKARHFGSEKPLGQILSATTYEQTRTTLPKTTSRRLLAFGDPVYREPVGQSGVPPDTGTRSRLRPETLTATDELALLRTRGLSLAPLPHTREEVEGLARLFGDDATVRLGPQATKSAVFREAADADLIHLACHAWFDPQIPLSSGLVLSQSGTQESGVDTTSGDDGLLQAWEVIQRLRLSADLVVLSACQTGLGQEVRGEGLVGLTRAFQYAGARSLVVTLWDVADASTALFMQAFYAALKDGATKDEALRRGVLALQADPRWNSPCYWAAFVLIGDRE